MEPEPLGKPIAVRLPEVVEKKAKEEAAKERRPLAAYLRIKICEMLGYYGK